MYHTQILFTDGYCAGHSETDFGVRVGLGWNLREQKLFEETYLLCTPFFFWEHCKTLCEEEEASSGLTFIGISISQDNSADTSDCICYTGCDCFIKNEESKYSTFNILKNSEQTADDPTCLAEEQSKTLILIDIATSWTKACSCWGSYPLNYCMFGKDEVITYSCDGVQDSIQQHLYEEKTSCLTFWTILWEEKIFWYIGRKNFHGDGV